MAAQELADARKAGKKLVIVVHPSIPRDPKSAEGRERKSELTETLQTSGLASVLERPNRIWLVNSESSEPDYMQVEHALAIDFDWAVRHAIIDYRLDRWKEIKDDSALLQGTELVELMRDAFADKPGREPVLTAEQREFLLSSQRHEVAERERVEGLYWGTQSRALAFAARERSEAEPDIALLLAAEAASVATVPEARAILLSLMHRHAYLTKVLNGHIDKGASRRISGVAFGPAFSDDKYLLASIDRNLAINDEKPYNLLIHEAKTGEEIERKSFEVRLTAVAWGQRWLAVASLGSISWLRWDEDDEKFRGNTPTSLEGDVEPDFLAFSPPGLNFPFGEVLAWGTQWGVIGLIRVGDHVRNQGRLGDDRSSNALTGLGWLQDGRLITAENGRILVRSSPDLELVKEIANVGRVYSLISDGDRWIAACTYKGLGLLFGKGDAVETFLPATPSDLGLIAAWAGPSKNKLIITGSTSCRSGEPAVTMWNSQGRRITLLQGENEPISRVAANTSGSFVSAGEAGGEGVAMEPESSKSHREPS